MRCYIELNRNYIATILNVGDSSRKLRSNPERPAPKKIEIVDKIFIDMQVSNLAFSKFIRMEITEFEQPQAVLLASINQCKQSNYFSVPIPVRLSVRPYVNIIFFCLSFCFRKVSQRV